MAAAGVYAVKFSYDDMSTYTKAGMPVLDAEVMEAAIDEAHANGLKAYAHAPILSFAKDVLRAGGDGLMHGILDAPVDEELVELMRANDAVYVATLCVYESADLEAWVERMEALDGERRIGAAVYERLSSDEFVGRWESMWDNLAFVTEHVPVAKANVRTLVDAGIVVAAGTDTGLPGILLGLASHAELVLHVEAGLTPLEALRVGTLEAARMLGRGDDLGSIEAGKVADLVILDADPLADIANTLAIHRVMKGGVWHAPAAGAR